MTPEHHRARRWRESHGLSLAQLADLTGYSPLAIRWLEKGMRPPRPGLTDRTTPPWIWQRWKNICAGVDTRLKTGKSFEW